MTLYVRQQKRHRCKEQTFGHCGRRQGWMIWENSIETCILSYVKQISSPGSMHETWCSGLVQWDDSEGWDGEEGRRGLQDGENMYTQWLIHVNVWQKLPQYFEVIQFNSVQSLSRFWLFATPWIVACQASLSVTNSINLGDCKSHDDQVTLHVNGPPNLCR